MSEPNAGGGIIVVDNDALIRDLLRSMLVNEGYSVFLAADGEEALSFAHRIRAQLVVLDLNMPKLNGFRTCEAMRSLPGYAHVPIVILTVYDGWDAREAARRIGATEFISKPFRADVLLQRLLTLMGRDEGSLRSRSAQEWRRQREPMPVYADAPELSHGLQVLNIYRR
jgi:DNA-binding response OmpR family regulator